MRRLAFVFAACAALAVPAAALAVHEDGDDGSLVVQNGAAAWNTPGSPDVPVVALKITGSVIGHVEGYGRIIIDAGSDTDAVYQVIGAGRPTDSPASDTASVWTAADFTFRAVGGKFTILIYGSAVNLVAAGKGSVRLAGLPDMPKGDGVYSLNDANFKSLPGIQTARLTIGSGS